MARTMQTFIVAPEGTMEDILKFIADTATADVVFTQYGGSIKLESDDAAKGNLDPLLDSLEAKFGNMQEGPLRTCDTPAEWK